MFICIKINIFISWISLVSYIHLLLLNHPCVLGIPYDLQTFYRYIFPFLVSLSYVPS